MLSFDEVIALVRRRPGLRLVSVDGLPATGKSTPSGRLAGALGRACIHLDGFVKPQVGWCWRD